MGRPSYLAELVLLFASERTGNLHDRPCEAIKSNPDGSKDYGAAGEEKIARKNQYKLIDNYYLYIFELTISPRPIFTLISFTCFSDGVVEIWR